MGGWGASYLGECFCPVGGDPIIFVWLLLYILLCCAVVAMAVGDCGGAWRVG